MEWSALEYTCSGEKEKKHTEIVRQDQINARVRHEKQEPTKKREHKTTLHGDRKKEKVNSKEKNAEKEGQKTYNKVDERSYRRHCEPKKKKEGLFFEKEEKKNNNNAGNQHIRKRGLENS